MLKRTFVLTVLTLLAGPAMAADNARPQHAAPEGTKVYIISPTDGATVAKTFTVRFGLKGMGVAPAGVDRPNTGHHHLLIDVDTMPPAGKPIPSDARHKHFGGGQTQTTLTLKPGTHTLQLELANSVHVPFAPPLVSQKITVHVK